MYADHIAPYRWHTQGTDVKQLYGRHKDQRLTIERHPAFVHTIIC